jgi:hypothetical protein
VLSNLEGIGLRCPEMMLLSFVLYAGAARRSLVGWNQVS